MKPIVLKIKALAASERKITAEIIDCIREVDRLKIHLEMGYPSVMEFLVRECGYSETSALRRIDAARIVNAIPEISEDLKNGSLNLSQVSIVAQSVRQKEKLGDKVSLETKKELLKVVQHKRTFEVQKIAAQILDLPVMQTEKVKVQSDESVRIEFSLTKAEMEIINKAKELLGHVKPGMNVKELVVLMAERAVKEKDPAREVRKKRMKVCDKKSLLLEKIFVDNKNGENVNSGSTSEFQAENSTEQTRRIGHGESNPISTSTESAPKDPKFNGHIGAADLSRPPSRVGAAVRRLVFQRDRACQWAHPTSGNKCGSRHLLEIDHKVSKWAGGSDEFENLELKCRAHNQWRYKVEARIRTSLSPKLRHDQCVGTE